MRRAGNWQATLRDIWRKSVLFVGPGPSTPVSSGSHGHPRKPFVAAVHAAAVPRDNSYGRLGLVRAALRARNGPTFGSGHHLPNRQFAYLRQVAWHIK